jgi:hypothetical protein
VDGVNAGQPAGRGGIWWHDDVGANRKGNYNVSLYQIGLLKPDGSIQDIPTRLIKAWETRPTGQDGETKCGEHDKPVSTSPAIDWESELAGHPDQYQTGRYKVTFFRDSYDMTGDDKNVNYTASTGARNDNMSLKVEMRDERTDGPIHDFGNLTQPFYTGQCNYQLFYTPGLGGSMNPFSDSTNFHWDEGGFNRQLLQLRGRTADSSSVCYGITFPVPYGYQNWGSQNILQFKIMKRNPDAPLIIYLSKTGYPYVDAAHQVNAPGDPDPLPSPSPSPNPSPSPGASPDPNPSPSPSPVPGDLPTSKSGIQEWFREMFVPTADSWTKWKTTSETLSNWGPFGMINAFRNVLEHAARTCSEENPCAPVIDHSIEFWPGTSTGFHLDMNPEVKNQQGVTTGGSAMGTGLRSFRNFCGPILYILTLFGIFKYLTPKMNA